MDSTGANDTALPACLVAKFLTLTPTQLLPLPKIKHRVFRESVEALRIGVDGSLSRVQIPYEGRSLNVERADFNTSQMQGFDYHSYGGQERMEGGKVKIQFRFYCSEGVGGSSQQNVFLSAVASAFRLQKPGLRGDVVLIPCLAREDSDDNDYAVNWANIVPEGLDDLTYATAYIGAILKLRLVPSFEWAVQKGIVASEDKVATIALAQHLKTVFEDTST